MTYQAKKGRPRVGRVAVLGVLAAATIGVGYWHVATAGHPSPVPAAPATATVGAPAAPPAAPSAVPSSSPTATPAASAPAAPATAVAAAPVPHRAATPSSSHPAASTTPAPAKVTHRAPAPVAPAGSRAGGADPVDPHPAMAVGQDSCYDGETWDGTQCVATQNPDEAIGGARCDDPAQVVVAVRPDGSYQCGPRP